MTAKSDAYKKNLGSKEYREQYNELVARSSISYGFTPPRLENISPLSYAHTFRLAQNAHKELSSGKHADEIDPMEMVAYKHIREQSPEAFRDNMASLAHLTDKDRRVIELGVDLEMITQLKGLNEPYTEKEAEMIKTYERLTGEAYKPLINPASVTEPELWRIAVQQLKNDPNFKIGMMVYPQEKVDEWKRRMEANNQEYTEERALEKKREFSAEYERISLRNKMDALRLGDHGASDSGGIYGTSVDEYDAAVGEQ